MQMYWGSVGIALLINNRGNGQPNDLAALPQINNPGYALEGWIGGPQSRSASCDEWQILI